MHFISQEKAMNFILNSRVVVHCESIYSEWKYIDIFNGNSDYLCYKLNGCIVLKNKNVQGIPRTTFNVHQISNKSDVCAVLKYIYENEKVEGKRTIMLYAYAPLQSEIDVFNGFRIYTRKGDRYEDSNIREITIDDEKIVKELCETSITDDNRYGKCEAESFCTWFEDNYRAERYKLFGIFDADSLVGLVSVKRFGELEIAAVSDVFVHKNYRRLGFGRRLVKAALSIYPEFKYCYQAAKQNDLSKALAISLGFKLVGAELFALDEE